MNFDTKTITSPFHCKLLTGPPQNLRLLEISPRTYVKELKLPHFVTFLQLFTKSLLNCSLVLITFFPSFNTGEKSQNMDNDRDAGSNIGSLYFLK